MKKVTISQREDRRWEVAVDGYVQAVHDTEAAAVVVAKQHGPPTLHREFQDHALRNAIGRMR